MTRKELVNKVSQVSGISKTNVDGTIKAMQDVIKDAVYDGEEVSITGFMTFNKKHIEEKSGVSKLKGDATEWTSPAKDIVSVKLSKSYREFH